MIKVNLAKPKRKVDKKLLKVVKMLPCVACKFQPGSAWNPVDPAHIRSKGSGGPDETWNVIALCRSCHGAQHKKGWGWLIRMFPTVATALAIRGWEFYPETGKLWHPNMSHEGESLQ